MANTIGTAYIQIEPSTDGIGGKISGALDGQMSSAGTSAGGKFASAFGAAAKVAGTALVASTAAVGAFAKTSIDAGMTFDSAMSQVGATMGFTTEEINDAGSEANTTMQKLRDFAQEMGSTTAFSASEAAEALNYMALAGYDADTAMEMLPTVLNLAAAGGIDLAAASDMVTDASSALGLNLDETAQMTDKMAAAASKSNTSVAQLGEAYLTVGGTAKSLSGGTTELSTALGLLADNGIKGSEAGTHLRNIMLAMNPTTDKAIEAWTSLGISAYDADGNLRPLEDTFADLNVAMADMTDQQKTDILTKMFNKTDLSSVNALLSTSSERWEELSAAIEDSDNAAADMAGVQLDNLAGDITLFQSALEGAKIAVSDQLTPSLREFVQFGSDGLSRLTEAFKEGGLSGVMSEFGTLLGELVNKIIEMLPQMIDAGIQLLSALGQGIMDNLPVIIDAALQIVNMLVQYLLDNLGSLLEAGLQIIVQLALGIAEALPTLLPQMTQVIVDMTLYLLENIDLLIDCAFKLMAGLALGIAQSLPIILEKLPAIGMGIYNGILTYTTYLLNAGKKLIAMMVQGMATMITNAANKARDIANAIKNAIMNKVSEFVSVGKDIVEGLKQGIENAWESITGWFSQKIDGLVETATKALKIGSPSRVFANEVGKWIPAGIAMGIEDNMGVLDDAMEDMTNTTSALATSATVEASVNTARMNASGISANDNTVYGLLAEYLPILASGNNVTVTLEGDAKSLFKSVQKQNNVYTRTTGRTAFA